MNTPWRLCNVTAVIGSCRPGSALGFCFFACPPTRSCQPRTVPSILSVRRHHHIISTVNTVRASPSIRARPTAQTQSLLSPYLTTLPHLPHFLPYLCHSNPWPSPASAPKPHPQHPQDRIVAFAFPCSAGNFEPTLPSAVTGNLRTSERNSLRASGRAQGLHFFLLSSTLPVRHGPDRRPAFAPFLFAFFCQRQRIR